MGRSAGASGRCAALGRATPRDRAAAGHRIPQRIDPSPRKRRHRERAGARFVRAQPLHLRPRARSDPDGHAGKRAPPLALRVPGCVSRFDLGRPSQYRMVAPRLPLPERRCSGDLRRLRARQDRQGLQPDLGEPRRRPPRPGRAPGRRHLRLEPRSASDPAGQRTGTRSRGFRLDPRPRREGEAADLASGGIRGLGFREPLPSHRTGPMETSSTATASRFSTDASRTASRPSRAGGSSRR